MGRERFLYQRDQPPTTVGGVVTFKDAKISQTPAPPVSNGSWYSSDIAPHDWIARTAPRGVIGFEVGPTPRSSNAAFLSHPPLSLTSPLSIKLWQVDARFAESPSFPLSSGWIKLTLFDVLEGTVSVTQVTAISSSHLPLFSGSKPPRA